MTKSAPKKRTQLINARERLGWNGAELADRIGINKSTVYRIEGGVSHPSLAMMQKWVKALPGSNMEMFRAPTAKTKHSGPGGGASAQDAAA